MAGNGGFGGNPHPLAPGSYSELLFGDEIEIPGLQTDGCVGFNSTTSSSFPSDDNNNINHHINNNAPKMLCFGDYAKQFNVKMAVENDKKTGQKSGLTCIMMDSSSKKRDGSGMRDPGDCGGAPTGSGRNGKKPKSENSTTVGGHAKVVKKEKLGERIAALQQLVSPFGKTDTASVLHEALGYIRFLHDQVQVLCSPYLQRCSGPPTAPDNVGEMKMGSERRSKDDLRSRGLCLVPVELTLHVAESNGADLWSSSAVVDSVSSN